MARLTNEIREVIRLDGEDVVFTLRRPMSEEICDFLARRYEYHGGKRVKDNSCAVRVELFDKLLMSVENLEDSQGVAITPERKDIIPVIWKHGIVFKNFEEGQINI